MSDQSAELWTRTFCPQCGWDVDTDEDGLCQACGAEAVGEGVEALCQEVDRIATLDAHLSDAHDHLAEAHRDNDALRRENTELRGQLARAYAALRDAKNSYYTWIGDPDGIWYKTHAILDDARKDAPDATAP